MDYEPIFDRYLDSHSGGKSWTQQTIAQQQQVLRRWASCNYTAELGHRDTRDVIRWLSSLPVSEQTRRNYESIVRRFYSWAASEYNGRWGRSIDWDKVQAGFNATPKPVVEHNWLTTQQVEQILAYPEGRHRDILQQRNNVLLALGFTAGLRRQEMRNLNWGDVDLVNKRIHVKGKGDKIASVAITERTGRRLQQWKSETLGPVGGDFSRLPVLCSVQRHGFQYDQPAAAVAAVGRRLSLSGINRIVVEFSQAIGIHFRPHDMRRTFAGLIHEAAGIEAASAALRHDNLATTQRYLERRQDAAAIAVEKAGLNL